MKRLVACAVLIGGVTAMAAPAVAAPPTSININQDYKGGEVCEFPINITVSGKTKTIDVGIDKSIVIAPQQKATITNLGTGETVTYVITGVFQNTRLENGNIYTKATGRNLLFDPVAGFVFVTGAVTYTQTSDGQTNVIPLAPLSGGDLKTEDVCTALEP